jgi:Branched-chain amino acid aminotransferase/4-amino-4-deoxychorismate lyase
MHRFLLHNGQIHEATEILLSPGQVGLLNGWGVFSTVRVHEGVLFAFERHWARMKRDAELMRVPFPWTANSLETELLKLVEANNARNATLRVAVIRNRGGVWEGPGIQRDVDLVAFTTQLKDWGPGVKLGVVPNARHAASRFAGTKVLSWAQNLIFSEEAHEKGLDEVVLLNERDEVSECTSANIFVVKGSEVLTPPLSSGCLPGVTRQVLLEEIRVPNLTIREEVLRLADMEAADEVFITSTTRDLLPITAIEGLKIRQGQRVRDILQAEFTKYLESYVQAKAGSVPAKS